MTACGFAQALHHSAMPAGQMGQLGCSAMMMLTPSPHSEVLCAPQPSGFCKDAGEQKISIHAKS